MSDLADLVGAYKREVAVPGAFTDAYPLTTDTDIVDSLGDAFGQAQLDGFFGHMVLDPDAGEIVPDLSLAGAALVVIYAGIRLVRQQIRSTRSSVTYKAGPVEFSSASAASALTEDLRGLEARRRELVSMALRAGRGGGTVFVLDAYRARSLVTGGFFNHELVSYGVW